MTKYSILKSASARGVASGYHVQTKKVLLHQGCGPGAVSRPCRRLPPLFYVGACSLRSQYPHAPASHWQSQMPGPGLWCCGSRDPSEGQALPVRARGMGASEDSRQRTGRAPIDERSAEHRKRSVPVPANWLRAAAKGSNVTGIISFALVLEYLARAHPDPSLAAQVVHHIRLCAFIFSCICCFLRSRVILLENSSCSKVTTVRLRSGPG
jgi:hypothetical protein